jgi:tripartite-type tricarboxylate transporter receptor subunit TctC
VDSAHHIAPEIAMKFALSLVACLLAFFLNVASAQQPQWPVKPVRLIVFGGPGGVTDIRARWLAERLTPALGQSVIVENKPGAAGNIGAEFVAHSAPDGYTLGIIHQGIMTINPHLYPKMGFDTLTDFVPITRLGIGPLVLVVNPELPAKSVSELIQHAKAHPGKVSVGSPGVGTPPHLAAELFKRLAGIDVIHVPFKGGGQAVTDLIAGHVNYSIEGLTVTLPHVKSGRLRALAVTGPRRVVSLPDVPTIAESGLPGYEYQGWVGIAAPAGTPRPVIDRLYREISSITGSAEGRAWFAEVGAEPGNDPPDALIAAIRTEHAKWGQIVREAGIKAE